MAVSGVYQILCKSNGHRYVGSSVDIEGRQKEHVRTLKRGKHRNKALQYAWETWGETDFVMSTLIECSEEDLTRQENLCIEKLKPEFNSKELSGRKSKAFKSVTTTVRLLPDLASQLKHASYILRKSQTAIISDSLEEYFDKHDISSGYQLNLTKDKIVLQKMGAIPEIVEIADRNGVSPKDIQEEYSIRLRQNVRLVVQEESSWPKKQS